MLINEIVQIDERVFNKHRTNANHIDVQGAKDQTLPNGTKYKYDKESDAWISQNLSKNYKVNKGSTVDKQLLKLAGFDKQGYKKPENSVSSRIGQAFGQDTTDGSFGQRVGAAAGATVGGVIGGTAGAVSNVIGGTYRGSKKAVSTVYDKTKKAYNNMTNDNDPADDLKNMKQLVKDGKLSKKDYMDILNQYNQDLSSDNPQPLNVHFDNFMNSQKQAQ